MNESIPTPVELPVPLPTMADLDGLEMELNQVDATLAELDGPTTSSSSLSL